MRRDADYWDGRATDTELRAGSAKRPDLGQAIRLTANSYRLIAGSRRLIQDSRALLARLAIRSTVGSDYAAKSPMAVSEPKSEGTGEPRTFRTVTELIKLVEGSVAADGGLLAQLVENILLAVDSKIDTDIVIGVLAQGIIQTLQDRMPVAEQRDAAIVLCSVIWDHIGAEPAGRA